MRYVVAVSGGVDSMVLLDIMTRKAKFDGDELIVAHFDHGIRDNSADDARFVQAVSEQYKVKYLSKREVLGPNASENTARTQRYAFLRQVARENDALLMTAHHRDDLVETIAINLHRGTGWRGVAVLAADDIARPLLSYSKQKIYDYAMVHKLEWVEDATNHTNRYLRNRLRQTTHHLPEQVATQLLELRRRQTLLSREIGDEASMLIGGSTTVQRFLVIMTDDASATELLRAAISEAKLQTPTRPQLSRALVAIKTARPGTQHQITSDTRLDFTTSSFIVNTP